MLFNTVMWLYYGFNSYLATYLYHENGKISVNPIQRVSHSPLKFDVAYRWTHLNFTWYSQEHYDWAVHSGRYRPENNAPTGLKIHFPKLYLSIPRLRDGIPATLTVLDMHVNQNVENPLLTPFPNWELNDESTSCSNLQSVQSMEIDTRGVMWVLDGVRINNRTRCPAKLVLLDLSNAETHILTYIFPERIASTNGGFLNDIVVDETNGDYAYITDNSDTDPGLIVYSRSINKSWKLRDKSMRPEPGAVLFKIEDVILQKPVPLDGIALTPRGPDGHKTVYYCAISAYTMYSIPTTVLKNRHIIKTRRWRSYIKNEGQKAGQSDGIIIDNAFNMYLTMLPQYGVATWNVKQSITSLVVTDRNKNMIWPDGFAFDQQGFLYVISNKIYNYIDPNRDPLLNGQFHFLIWKAFTDTKSYLFDHNLNI